MSSQSQSRSRIETSRKKSSSSCSTKLLGSNLAWVSKQASNKLDIVGILMLGIGKDASDWECPTLSEILRISSILLVNASPKELSGTG